MPTGEPSASSPGAEVREDSVVFVGEDFENGGGYIVCCIEEIASVEAPYTLSSVAVPDLPASLEQLVIKQCPLHLRPSSMHGVSVVVSTKSGTGLALKCWEAVVKPLLELVQELAMGDGKQRGYDLVVTQNARTVKEFGRSKFGTECGPGSDTIILLSGDGGVVDLLNETQEATYSNPPAICLLPLGTGNALFHSLHKPLYTQRGPSPLVHGLRTLLRGHAEPLSVFRADFSPGATLVPAPEESGISTSPNAEPISHLLGAIVASYGFHASIVWESDTPEYRIYGSKRFGMVAQNLLQENHAYKAIVSIKRPGQDSSIPLNGSEFSYVLATMVSNLEKDFTISPDSQPLDGKLRLVHFEHLGLGGGMKTWDIMKAAYDQGAHVKMDEVGYNEVKEVRVKINENDERWRKVCVDGTIVELEEGGWMTVEKAEKSPLKIIVHRHNSGE